MDDRPAAPRCSAGWPRTRPDSSRAGVTGVTGPRSRALIWTSIALLAAIAASWGYLLRHRQRFPAPDSPPYQTLVRSFYRGLAALQVGLLSDAKTDFQEATAAVPSEPATWANLSITLLRLGEFDTASDAIARAGSLAPSNSAIALIEGEADSARGRVDTAMAAYQRAVSLDGNNLRARYALIEQIEASGRPDADASAQQQLSALQNIAPSNLAVVLERGRLAAKQRDFQTLRDTQARLSQRSGNWPASASERMRAFDAAVAAQDAAAAGQAIVILRNVLLTVAEYRNDLLAVRTPAELTAEPFDRFLALPSPSTEPSPLDNGLTFTTEALAGTPTTVAALAVSPDGSRLPDVFTIGLSNGPIDRHAELRRLGPQSDSWPIGGASSEGSSISAVALDWNRDFKVDFAIAGRGGLRLLIQTPAGGFTDTTAQASRGVALTDECDGVWAADVDLDGDMDMVVGVRGKPPVVLRNNGDGTWTETHPFTEVSNVRHFAWGDFDGDGTPDAAMIDADGVLHLFENRQGGAFRSIAPPQGLVNVLAVAIGDLNADGLLDLVLLDKSGRLIRATRRETGWDERQIAAWPNMPAGTPGKARLILADLDNNGAIDVVASSGGASAVWLADGRVQLQAHAVPANLEIVDVADLDGDGQLDAVAIASGNTLRLLGHGTKGYHWQVFRPRAQESAGDQRINSFGVGGDIQVRSDLLVEHQLIAGNVVHMGLGSRTVVDVVRIVWPNGVLQADFRVQADQTLVADQRLKGSCPWVFTYDGHGMRFVTDFLWRSPLGLRINAQDTAGVSQTEDWVKIRGDQLVPRHGVYDVRITAELWETHFIDRVALMEVDHPQNMEVFVDERFATPPPELAVLAVAPPQPIAHAWDDAGRDVTDLVAARDARYVATFARGPYQGVAEDHFVEIDLGREIDGPLWLIANGWIYPTDSSINMAIGQRQDIRPHGLALEAQDSKGHWKIVEPDLGFPAGKNKTILIDLAGASKHGLRGVHRIRLRTNLEVYWDWLAVARGADVGQLRRQVIAPTTADLRYRGFSRTAYTRTTPEIPQYDALDNVGQRWRDLVGYYTRFGDVRELMDRSDDRYVIMNAGDELRLRFPASPPPPSGWTRDFVLVGDGWVKDGDFNTQFSKTVLPLPAHDRVDYGSSSASEPQDLEQDPVFRRHPNDWLTYHTRFVVPSVFLRGLR